MLASCVFLSVFLCTRPQSPNALSINNLDIPIDWAEIPLSVQHTSMSTVVDESGSVYLCGGKISLYGASSKCIGIEIQRMYSSASLSATYSVTQTYSGGSGLKLTGPFPGVYLSAKPFIAETQNEGAMYNNRMCMLSISDGTNKPKCWCCNVGQLNQGSSTATIKCDDLQYSTTGCPERYDACTVHDHQRNLLYQIGGYYGQTIYDTILCFDLETETYLAADECQFASLVQPRYGMGCDLLSNYNGNNVDAIVVVGGLDTLSTTSNTVFSRSIEICPSDGTPCTQIPLPLHEGILKPRAVEIDNCHIAIVGGKTKGDGLEIISDHIDIANVCDMQWITQQHDMFLPLPLSEMSIIKLNGILCLYGGVSLDQTTLSTQLSTSVYCTDLGFTASPTSSVLPTSSPLSPPSASPTLSPSVRPTASPTAIPTVSPTAKPTATPTHTDVGHVVFNDPQFQNEFVSFNQGISGQICSSDSQSLYVCGGYHDASSSLNSCFVYNEHGDKQSLPMYVSHSLQSGQDISTLSAMPSFFCKTQCSAMNDNQLFLVNPTTTTQDGTQLYQCAIYDTYILCVDLCSDGELQFCDNLLHSETCVTSHGQYLFISGGYDKSGEISQGIVVFDMEPTHLDWVSVPESSIAAVFGYATYFGSLSSATASHSCSYWNSTLYVIGGVDATGLSQSAIQICPHSESTNTNTETVTDCYTSPITLSDARYNARSTVIGSSIITVCGAKSADEFSGSVEIYDAFFDQFESSSMLYDDARSACCLIDWHSKSKLVISGGEQWIGSQSQTADNMIFSQYAKEPLIVQPVPNNHLLDCKHINVDTRDFSFKAVYDLYNQINDYYIFATSDGKAYFVVDATGEQKTWIYNFTEKTSCFYNSEDGNIVDLGPGLWTKPRTRYSQTHSILITLSCMDASMVSSEPSNSDPTVLLFGMTEASFITCVVVGAFIVITVLMVAFCCWWRRTSHSALKASYTKKTKKKKSKDLHKRQRLGTAQDDDEEDDDEDEEDEEWQHDTRTLGKTYVSANSYSQINTHDHDQDEAVNTITIIRHSTLENKEHSAATTIELQETEMERRCNIARIRSQSDDEEEQHIIYDDGDDDDDEPAEVEDIDKSSSSTVNPHEVKFGLQDKNTAMIDQIAMELDQQQQQQERVTIHRRTQSLNTISPKYKRQEPHKAAQSMTTIYMQPSDLNLSSFPSEVQSTPSMEPVLLLTRPPPPPLAHITMNTDCNEVSQTHNASYSDQQSSVFDGAHSHLKAFDELTDVSHANDALLPFQPTQSRMSVTSVSKDNYAGHVSHHISQHPQT